LTLVKIDVIWTYFGQTTPLDPLRGVGLRLGKLSEPEAMAGFEKIMKHKSQWDNPPEADKSGS